MPTRILLATALGTFGFIVASSIGFAAACSWSSVAACTGSAWEILPILVGAKIGVSVLVFGFATTLLTRRFKWHRPWHLLATFVGWAVLLPRIYSWNFQLPRPVSLFDFVYPAAGFFMGLVILWVWHKRSNNSFKPTPLRG